MIFVAQLVALLTGLTVVGTIGYSIGKRKMRKRFEQAHFDKKSKS